MIENLSFSLKYLFLIDDESLIVDEGRVSVHETTEEGESLLSLACSAGYYELAQVWYAIFLVKYFLIKYIISY